MRRCLAGTWGSVVGWAGCCGSAVVFAVGRLVVGLSNMSSSSETPTSVAGVADAGTAGVGGGVAPVCGSATVSVVGTVSRLEEEESVELGPKVVGDPFGVGGTMGMNVLFGLLVLEGAVMCNVESSRDMERGSTRETGVGGRGGAASARLRMLSCSSTYCTVAMGMSEPMAMCVAWSSTLHEWWWRWRCVQRV